MYARTSRTWEITLDGNDGKYGLYTNIMSDKGFALCNTYKNVEWEEALRCTYVWELLSCER